MQNIIQLMSFYNRYHTKKITQLTHFIGVPMITMSLLILLSWVHINFAEIASISVVWIGVIFLLAFYIKLDLQLGLIAALFFLPMTWIAQLIAHPYFNIPALIIFVALFVLGWAVQLIGHYYEGRHPALLDNLFQILVAPIFLVAELLFRLGYKKNLEQQLNNFQNNE